MPASATIAKIFRDRTQAGRILAARLSEYACRSDVIVVALPRGGVPVGYEVAKALGAPLDLLVVRKLGVPGHEELAMGAIGPGGVRVMNEDIVDRLSIPEEVIEEVATRERQALERRLRLYRGDRPSLNVSGKNGILVDDGLATGASMRVAVRVLRSQHPAAVVVAVPVAPPEVCEALRSDAEKVVCAQTPAYFTAIGACYEDFAQMTDDEVRQIMRQAESLSADSG